MSLIAAETGAGKTTQVRLLFICSSTLPSSKLFSETAIFGGNEHPRTARLHIGGVLVRGGSTIYSRVRAEFQKTNKNLLIFSQLDLIDFPNSPKTFYMVVRRNWM